MLLAAQRQALSDSYDQEEGSRQSASLRTSRLFGLHQCHQQAIAMRVCPLDIVTGSQWSWKVAVVWALLLRLPFVG